VPNQKNKAASPGYKTPNEKFNAEFAEENMENMTTTAKKVSRNSRTKQGSHTQ